MQYTVLIYCRYIKSVLIPCQVVLVIAVIWIALFNNITKQSHVEVKDLTIMIQSCNGV